MEATITQITREMEDARLTAEWCKNERDKLLEKQREAHRAYYQLKAELKTLTEKQHEIRRTETSPGRIKKQA